MKKRLVAAVMAIIMVVTLVPAVSFAAEKNGDIRITVPTGAKCEVTSFGNHYAKGEAITSIQENNTYTYNLEGNKTYAYRVSMSGKITKAGYINSSSDDITIDFDKNSPQVSESENSENGVLLNVNEKNVLPLETEENFILKAYRIWQIVNNKTGNNIIEPDFNFEIISGADCIELKSPIGNETVIQGIKEGVAVVEVTYKPIDISGGSEGLNGLYSGIDQNRKGLVVVEVGKTKADVAFDLGDFDVEKDTVYFDGNKGNFTFTAETDAVAKVGSDVTEYKEMGGKITIPVSDGNNIVKITKGDKEAYFVIRGSKISYKIENKTRPGGNIAVGDKVEISFNGLNMPVPKMAALYNPGYGNTIKVVYSDQTGKKYESEGAQYDFAEENSISFIATKKGNINLTKGKINLKIMGLDFGKHREIPNSGLAPNLNAKEIVLSSSTTPDISVNVENDYRPSKPTMKSVTLYKSYKQIRATWTKSEGATGYTLYYRRLGASSYAAIDIPNGSTTSWTKPMSRSGAKYYVKVVPYKTVGGVKYKGSESNLLYAYTLRAPSLSLARTGSRTIRVKWSNISGESGYMVYRKTGKYGKYSKKAFSSSYSTWYDGYKTKGRTYYYKIKAYRKVGTTTIYGPYSTLKYIKR